MEFGTINECALKLRALERGFFELRLRERNALQVGVGEVDFRQNGESENRTSEVAAAGAKHKIASLHLVRIVDS